ncbi:hypothetical protein BDW22DRAFT_1357821 [Trametopsis cervina]|nr:hypothetical protein BDW22DRAFT_1357821 [Trametopsis cervina]
MRKKQSARISHSTRSRPDVQPAARTRRQGKNTSAESDPLDSASDTDDLTTSVPASGAKRKPATRSTRSSNAPQSRSKTAKRPRTTVDTDEEDASEEDGEDEEDAFSLDSDALDEDPPPRAKPARKAASSGSKAKASPKKTSPKKKKRKASPDAESSDDLEEGQEIVGVVVQAPKTGRVPPGQISQNTLNFLTQLKDPECNDREWFKLHEPVYRLAEKEWKDFVEEFTDTLVESDPQIPHLPPKDVIHRIYRDVRFSNDKTPYKTGFSASFSRSGRKGIFAGYFLAVKSGGESLLAAGSWCPGKNELATIRNNIQRSSTRLRAVISEPRFEELFGKAKPHPKGARQNIWGMDDELKVAPKGVDKNHPDIDLLKCRSFAVAHYFTDEQVLQPNFKEQVGEIVRVMRPFVHCINDLMTIPNLDADSDNDDDDALAGDDDDDDED